MTTLVDLDELIQALEWVSGGAALGFDNAAFVDRESGTVLWTGADNDEDDLPDDLEESDRYIAVPTRSDLGLGARTALAFARESMGESYSEVKAIFGRRGAFGRFKDLLASRGLLDAWRTYEQSATESALRDWTIAHDLQVGPAPQRPARNP